MTITALVVWALAVARVTRLVNADQITDWLRLYPARRVTSARAALDDAVLHNGGRPVAVLRDQIKRWAIVYDFLTCPWCVGMWVALTTAWLPLLFSQNRVVQYLGIALAVSHVVGVCARFADTEELEVVDERD